MHSIVKSVNKQSYIHANANQWHAIDSRQLMKTNVIKSQIQMYSKKERWSKAERCDKIQEKTQ